MSEHGVVNAESGKQEHREKLGPVAAAIFGLYVIILTTGYFVGNMIYQIP